MNWVSVNVLIILIGISLLVGLPFYFKHNNLVAEYKADYEKFLNNMLTLDKQYAVHFRQLNKNLNTINHWLKTGKDPTEDEEESEKVEQEDKFFAGLMNPLEAKKWKEAVKKAKAEDTEDFDVKSIRVEKFDVEGMDPTDVGQTKMSFTYAPEFEDCIYYCATPDALEKHMYKCVVFFTTSRPTNIPLVYPYKYEGAQMLSLYKHPGQTIWFLKNWKLIREGLEALNLEEIVELDESIKDFDL